MIDSGITLKNRLADIGLSNEEGCLALEQVLALPAPQIMVSKLKLSEVNTSEPYIVSSHSDSNVNIPLTEQIKNIWLDVLGVQDINESDDFFTLGGDSLIAVQLSYKLGTMLNISVSPDVIIAYPVFKDFLEQCQ